MTTHNKDNDLEPQPRPEQAFLRLKGILDVLREECPWDRKQTVDTLRKQTIEEVYELSEAIIAGDFNEIKKELGDVMLHLLFYARIADEKGLFDIADVLNQQCDKLIERHPHIYGDSAVTDDEEVKRNWEQIKLQKGARGVMAGVPTGLPAMVKAMRIQDKAHGVGFDWDNTADVLAKIKEELAEVEHELNAGQQDNHKLNGEIGDLLFSVINLARFKGFDAEAALEATNQKFLSRFNYIEQQAQKEGKQVSDLSLGQMEEYWQEAKTSSGNGS